MIKTKTATGVKDQLTGVKDQLTGVKDQLKGVKDQPTGVKDQLRVSRTSLTGVSRTSYGCQGPADHHGKAQKNMVHGRRIKNAAVLMGLTASTPETVMEIWGSDPVHCSPHGGIIKWSGKGR